MGNEGINLNKESVLNRRFILQSPAWGSSEKAENKKLHLLQPTLPPPVPKESQGTDNLKKMELKPKAPSIDSRLDSRLEDIRVHPGTPMIPFHGTDIKLDDHSVKKDLEKTLTDKGVKAEGVKIYLARFEKFKTEAQIPAIKKDLLRLKDINPDDLHKEVEKLSATKKVQPLHPHAPTQPSGMEKVDAHIQKLPPAVRPIAEQAKIEGSRNILFYTLTGEQFASAKPVNLSKDIKVIEPPLTRGEALAYMQSQNLTDEEGNPLKDTTAGSFLSGANSIQSGELDRKSIVNWERDAIVNVLRGDPYKVKGQQIVNFMSSKGWLSDHPNVELMEGFRKRAAAHKEVEAVRQEVSTAKAPLSMDISEKDRGDQILENLNTKKNKYNGAAGEARANRATSKEEGRAGRDASLKAAKIREDGENKRARESRESQSEQSAKERVFRAHESELERKHRSGEDEKNRQNQMVMALIQFIGQMISSALQAMSSTIAASIQGQQQLAGQLVGGMKGRA